MIGLLLAASLYGEPELLARLPFEETSGIAVTGRGIWLHEDSGADAVVSRVARDGTVLESLRLRGLRARDWEDMAAAPDAAGVPSLWFGDIGDNDAERDGVQVHRVAESAPTGRVTTVRYTYADGPRDAEALLVLPGGREVVVVSKELSGTGVYAGPADGGVLRRVADVALRPTGTAGGPAGAFSQLLVTGGDVSPDGSRLVLRTYTDLYEWELQDDLAATFAQEPAVSPLPETEQGEAVAYEPDGAAVLVASEGDAAPLHRLVRQAATTALTAPPDVDTTRPGPGLWLALVAGGTALALALQVLRRRRR